MKLQPSMEIWILYEEAYAVSQFSATVSTCLTEPRSTCHHWLSAKEEDQRVVELPSFARSDVYRLFWVDEAEVGWERARSARTIAVTAEAAGWARPGRFRAK